ncbi:oxidoreductase, short-chain dehydrogenase/reductase family protein [Erythrobacter sp. NAP1]|uniref:SDR family NAD(P)-dependent oxidoreductase n=1 Tax=Erythrobacter sp. NAP1 TaxID=237727 RepID=UPI00006876AB|nr:SDR family NAD(P)-dependent oxidoreductase [Erythrobacter sp. NAP1]EAQ28086.1 oxidoreductase, short-chain dehydrogenase/reductase family protein [Erythrobacter sp. NAP1]
MSEFGHDTTADEVLEGKDLSGKTVFITGGNSGLGQETGRAMAAKGAHVILAGRDQGKLDEAVSAIRSEVPDANLETITCDLASLDSVHAAGAEANERFDKIDLLINNAGVMACPKMHTDDGFEMQLGTNHLGHFALTKHLMPLVEAGTDKRIVNLSSRGHHIAPVDFDDPNFESTDYVPFLSYGRSKTANVLFTVGLEKRFGDKGIHSYAVHPGGIQTNLGRHMSEEESAALVERVTENDPGFSWKTIPQGAATQTWAATADELEGKGGLYCEDCNVAEVDDASPNSGVRTYALDPVAADKLWAMSEEMTGVTFA